jgi:hypothetical protein
MDYEKKEFPVPDQRFNNLIRLTQVKPKHKPLKPRSQVKKRRAAPFDLCSKRTREIAMITIRRHGGLPDTDDRNIYLEAAAQHLNPRDGDVAFALSNWARRLGTELPQREIDGVVREVKRNPRRYKALTLGKMLRVTYEERCALRLTTIRCYDVSWAECVRRSKEIRRRKEADKRRRNGAKSRAEYLAGAKSRRQPWVAEGISKRTWYRRQRAVAQVRDDLSSLSSKHGLVPTTTEVAFRPSDSL